MKGSGLHWTIVNAVDSLLHQQAIRELLGISGSAGPNTIAET